MGCSPSGTDCSSMGPLWGRRSCQKTSSRVGFPTGDDRSCQEPAPAWALHRVTASFKRIHRLWHRFLHGLQGGPLLHGRHLAPRQTSCSMVDVHGLQRDSLLHHELLYRMQGNFFFSTRSISSHSFFTDLGVCRVVFHIFSLSLPAAVAQHFF